MKVLEALSSVITNILVKLNIYKRKNYRTVDRSMVVNRFSTTEYLNSRNFGALVYANIYKEVSVDFDAIYTERGGRTKYIKVLSHMVTTRVFIVLHMSDICIYAGDNKYYSVDKNYPYDTIRMSKFVDPGTSADENSPIEVNTVEYDLGKLKKLTSESIIGKYEDDLTIVPSPRDVFEAIGKDSLKADADYCVRAFCDYLNTLSLDDFKVR